MYLRKINHLFLLTTLILSSLFSMLSADQVSYWELTPESEMGAHYAFSATVLATKQEESSTKILLRIRDGRNSERFCLAWGESSSESSDQLMLYSIGDNISAFIEKNQPSHVAITSSDNSDEKNQVSMDWKYTNQTPWEIPNNIQPINDNFLTLDGIDYSIYSGEVISFQYKTWIWENLEDCQWTYHQIEIDISIKGGEVKHYIDKRVDDVYTQNFQGKKFSSEGFKDEYIKLLRYWSEDDQIIILSNCYYSGFWWILNETRDEAIYIVHGQVQKIDRNLWSRL